MVYFPPAKINLGLYVERKRPDGYHDLLTCFLQVPCYDILEIMPAESQDDALVLTGITIPDSADGNSNLVTKALSLIRMHREVPPVYIHLHKQIPMGAGLGGGSADGAYALRGINEVFSLGLADAMLHDMASVLGSDCPLFLGPACQLGQGRGTELTPISLDLKGYQLLLVNPGIFVSTKEAFEALVPREADINLADVLASPIESWKDALLNDFEKSVFLRYPAIQTLKDELYTAGAVYASMSGSGSTVYGIFSGDDAGLPALKQKLQSVYPFVFSCELS
jgi:4-diphosphocytidyl-2-C-methyl-D-erythritol kinase